VDAAVIKMNDYVAVTCNVYYHILSGFPRRHETSVYLAIKAAVTQEDNVFSFIKHVFLVFRQSCKYNIFTSITLRPA